MKVLKKGDDILTLPVLDDNFIAVKLGEKGERKIEGKATVAEATDAEVNAQLRASQRGKEELKDTRRDLKWLNKALIDTEVGTEIGMTYTGSGIKLDVPKGSRPNRAEGLKPGDKIAVGPNIRPKAWMNARGEVVEINGKRAACKIDAGDRDRIHRSTGKAVSEIAKLPIGSVEKI